MVVKFVRLFHSPAGRLGNCGGRGLAPDPRILRAWTEARPWSLREKMIASGRSTQVSIEQLKAVHGKTHPAETGKKA